MYTGPQAQGIMVGSGTVSVMAMTMGMTMGMARVWARSVGALGVGMIVVAVMR
jgi:hypothetical protein